MEDVLDVYELPYDSLRPVVCMDEKSYQLLWEAREAWAMRPGDDKKLILNLYVMEPVMYPDAENIILVMDNLNIHKPASLYKKYPPEKARKIIKKLDIHYTPKHGSWLVELNVMTQQCLSCRIESIDILRDELATWKIERITGRQP